MFVFVFQLFVLETHTVLTHQQTLPLCTYGCFDFGYYHNPKDHQVTRLCVFCALSDLPQLPTAKQDATHMTSVRLRAATRLVVAKQPLIKWLPVCVCERCKINFQCDCWAIQQRIFSSMFLFCFFIHILHVIAPFVFNKYKF